jgi:hypothetical protein
MSLPNLGLATTRELMEELSARSRIQAEPGTMDRDVASDMEIYLGRRQGVQGCSEEFLNYRTYKGEKNAPS